MKVQRIRFPDTNRFSWIVLDDNSLPVIPILTFLKFFEDLGRSPYTVRASAHHLKLFWEFLRDKRIDWKDIAVAHLAEFICWLRNPQPSRVSRKVYEAQRTVATINQILNASSEKLRNRRYLRRPGTKTEA